MGSGSIVAARFSTPAGAAACLTAARVEPLIRQEQARHLTSQAPMLLGRLIKRGVNRVLGCAGFELRRVPAVEKPWDDIFTSWIEQARVRGVDPNDVGDAEWSDDHLPEVLERSYLPHIRDGAVVLELGPGTGRLTRHLIARAGELILVDYSQAACEWLDTYLRGKARYRIHQIHGPALPDVAGESVDVIVAHGVFEHIDFDDLMCFLEEFHRVLRPGGVASFNFDNPMSDGGLQWFHRWRRAPGERNVFRFLHPDLAARAAGSVGFEVLRLTTDESRFAHIELEKAPRR